MSEQTLTPNERLKSAERIIQSASTEITIRQRQLNELKPQRKEIAEQAQSLFGCTIDELPQKLSELQDQMSKSLDELEKKLEEAQNPPDQTQGK